MKLSERHDFGRDERGVTAIIVALSLVALIGFLALVIDVGQLFLMRNRLQAAADSATLAAAQDLAKQQDTVTAMATAERYTDENVEAGHQTSVSFPSDTEVRVRLQAEQATFFGAIFGRPSVAVSAEATAGYKAASKVRDTVPIIVPFQAIEGHVGSGNVTTFEVGDDGTRADSSQRGFFWLVNFSGGSAGVPEYDDWIVNGYQDPVSVGMIGNGEGMKASLDSALAQRMSSDPSVIVPLFDYREAQGSNKAYHVVGFAEFVITGFNFHGNPKTISGYFTSGTMVEGETSGTPPVDYGVNVVRLKG